MAKSTRDFVYIITDTGTGRFVIYNTKPKKVQLLDIVINDLYMEENIAKDRINADEIIVDKVKIRTLD